MTKHTTDYDKRAMKFYKSKSWIKCRQAYIYEVHGLCEHCDKTGYIVDHIEELHAGNIDDPNITLNHDNLQYLCIPCHNKKTFRKHEPLRKDVKFNESGELIPK